MPELKGSKVLAHLQKEKRYDLIPRIVLSTSNTPGYIHECLNNDAAEYFVKGNSLPGVIALAKKILDYCKHTS